MANRPRLPNVDPKDLEKFASQYPGSGSDTPSTATPEAGAPQADTPQADTSQADTSKTGTDQTESSKGGGTETRMTKADSAPSDAATSSGTSSATPSATPPGTSVSSLSASGSGSTGSGGSGSGGSGSGGSGSGGKKSGGFFSPFMTFVFALIALLAAAAAIGAPSYRAEIRALLLTHVPQMNEATVDMVTGYDGDRLEVTFDGLDQRIDRLTEALERVVDAGTIDREAARELLLGDQMARDIEQIETRVDALTMSADEMSVAVPEQAQAIDAIKADLAASTARLDEQASAAKAELDASIEALQTDLASVRADADALKGRADNTDLQMADADSARQALAETSAALEDRVTALTADFEALLDVNENLATTVSVFQAESMPVLALVQLDAALQGSAPFSEELAYASEHIGPLARENPAFATLAKFAPEGVASIGDLRSDLVLIETQLEPMIGSPSTWGSQISDWFGMLVGSRSTPAPRSTSTIAAGVRAIEEALSRGDLRQAMQETSVLGTRSGVLNDWVVGLRDRASLAAAFEAVEADVYQRGTPEAGPSEAGAPETGTDATVKSQ